MIELFNEDDDNFADEKEGKALKLNWREAMKHGATRKVLYDILKDCGIYDDTFRLDDSQAYLGGKKAVGYFIKMRMEDVDPQAYHKLIMGEK